MIINKGRKMKSQTTYRRSKQRQRILEVLNSTRSHPTAAWLYDQLKPEFPSLSLGTVYRNLHILEEQGSIVKLTSGSTFDRYDAVTDPHAHFRCIKCGNVYDVDSGNLRNFHKTAEKNMEHEINEIFIEFRGICKECRKKEKNEGQHFDTVASQ